MVETGRILLAVLACALVAACDDAPPPAAKPDAGSSRPSADQGPGLPPDMVAAVSASRSSLIIGVHFALRATPTVGGALPVDIAVVPRQEFAKVSLHVTSQDGLRVVSGADMPPQPGAVGKLLPHKVTLEPSREGVFMVTAAVETEGPEGTITRLYSIPVIVSSSTPAAAEPAASQG